MYRDSPFMQKRHSTPMDSKPIAIIIGIVITVGAMGSVGLYATNILTGTSTSTDIIPKTVELISIDKDHLEANIQFTNQGTDTLTRITATMEFEGNINNLVVKTPIVQPYERIWMSGSIDAAEATTRDNAFDDVIDVDGNAISIHCSTIDATTTPASVDSCVHTVLADQWEIYPGESVLLRLNLVTASDDQIEKLIEVTVK